MNTMYWWNIYGPFEAGENQLPHIGQVIRYYRKMCNLGQEDLAHLLGCTKRYVEMLESNKNLTMPDLLSRRILLAKALHIPPILLGLSPILLSNEVYSFESIQNPLDADTTFDKQQMIFYEGMLALSWEFYYTSSLHRAAKNIESCFEMLNKDAKNNLGVQHDQFESLRCRFFRLSALVAREYGEIDKAVEHINTAVALATNLRNAELIASSLIGRIRIHFYKQQYIAALQDAEKSCTFADRDLLRDPLKGKCYQMAGETQAYVAGDNKLLQEKSLAYFDKAGRIARKGNLEPDGSFVKTDLTSIYIERAKALRLFHRFHEAHNALAIARKNLSPEVTRWQVNLLIEEAKTFLVEEDVTGCCYSLMEAVPIIRAIHLQSREEPIRSLLEKCKKKEARNEVVLRLEKIVMQKNSAS